MAENIVVKEQLTEAMVEAGGVLTRDLIKAGLPLAAAFWLFMPEINEWRLIFSSPDAPARGPLRVYERIRLALESLGNRTSAVRFSNIGQLNPNAETVRALQTTVIPGRGVDPVRVTRTAINGHYIDDALVYPVA